MAEGSERPDENAMSDQNYNGIAPDIGNERDVDYHAGSDHNHHCSRHSFDELQQERERHIVGSDEQGTEKAYPEQKNEENQSLELAQVCQDSQAVVPTNQIPKAKEWHRCQSFQDVAYINRIHPYKDVAEIATEERGKDKEADTTEIIPSR